MIRGGQSICAFLRFRGRPGHCRVRELPPAHRDGPGGARFHALHAARAQVEPERGDAPFPGIIGIFLDGAEGLVEEEDRGLALPETGAAIPRVNAHAVPAFFIIYGNPCFSLYMVFHVSNPFRTPASRRAGGGVWRSVCMRGGRGHSRSTCPC